MFNNGDRSGSQNDYSSVEEITAPLSGYTYTLPYNQSQHWMYSNGGTFYSNHLSGAFRLKNGNTLATEGTSGRISKLTIMEILFFNTLIKAEEATWLKRFLMRRIMKEYWV